MNRVEFGSFFCGRNDSLWHGNVFTPNEIHDFCQMSLALASETFEIVFGKKWKLVAAWNCQNASDRTRLGAALRVQHSAQRNQDNDDDDFLEKDVRQSGYKCLFGAGKWVGKAGRRGDDRLSRAYTSLARKDVLINCNFPLLVLVTSMKSHEPTLGRTTGRQDVGGCWCCRILLAKFQPFQTSGRL